MARLAPCRFAVSAATSVGLAIAAGCHGENASVKRVDLWNENGNSCSAAPVTTSLYDYLPDAVRGKYGFKVSSIPPLRFAFPAIYYNSATNLRGGPQSFISLTIDRVTGKASTEVGRGYCSSNITSGLSRNENQLFVRIDSNIMGKTTPIDPDLYFIDYRNEHYFRKRAVKPVGRMGPFDMFAYDQATDRGHSADLISDISSDVGLDKGYYIGYATAYKASNVKYIECNRANNTCNIVFFYEGRQVVVVVPKAYAAQSDVIAADVLRLFDRFNLDKRVVKSS